MNEIEEAVIWSGPAVISLFTLGASDYALRVEEFEMIGMKPNDVEMFRLGPDPEGQRGIVHEFDLTFDDSDHDFVPYLRECLKKASTEADGIAWLAFEGSFHYDHLFTRDAAEKIYGYCIPYGTPVAIWDGAILKSDQWKCEISEVHSFMDRAFPIPQTD